MRSKKTREVNIFSASVVDLFASGLGVFLIVSIIALVNQKKENAKLGKGGTSSVEITSLSEKIGELEKKLEKQKDENFILKAKVESTIQQSTMTTINKNSKYISRIESKHKVHLKEKELKKEQLKNVRLLEKISSNEEKIIELKKEIKRISFINKSQGEDSSKVFSEFSIGDKITLEDVRFYPGTDRPIEPYASREIMRFAKHLIKNESITVEVSGHIFETKKAINDGKADDVYNLSGRRAKSVCMKLIEFGVSDKRLRCIGYGANRPVYLTDDQYSEKAQKNRRVEIEFLSK